MTDQIERIFAETRDFTEAWNRGDSKAAASFFAEDGVRVGAFGDQQRGRAEIEASYDRLLHQTMPGAKVNQQEGQVRFLTSEYAVWHAGIEIIPPDAGPAINGHVVQVMRKVEDRWLILESHPKFFPSSPVR